MKKKSAIKKMSAIEAANNMLAALDLTADDFEKERNLEASYQIDLARHYLKKAIEEGELSGLEVPEDIFEASEDYLLPDNDLSIEVMDEDPYEEDFDATTDLNADAANDGKPEEESRTIDSKDAEDLDDKSNDKVSEEDKDESSEGLKAFDYDKVAYVGDIRSRMASLAKRKI